MIITDLSKPQQWIAARGFNNQFTCTFTLSGSAFDISDYTFTLKVRAIGTSTPDLITLTEGGGLTNGGETGILTVNLTAGTSETVSVGSYFYVIEYDIDGLDYRLLHGTLDLTNEYQSCSPSTSVNILVRLEGTNVNLAITLGSSGGAVAWGAIGGTLSDQTDLQTALNAKEATANKDQNSGYVGRDSSGEASLVGITLSSTTASTLAFISSAKKLITATGALLGTWIAGLTAKASPVDGDILLIGDSAASNESKKVTLLQAWTNYFLVKGQAVFIQTNTNLGQIGALTFADDDILQMKSSVLTNRTLSQYRRDLLDTKKYARFYSDFGAMLAPYVNSASGTGATAAISSIAGTATHPGTATCQTGSTSSGQAYITLSASFNNFLLGGGSWFFDTALYINVLPVLAERFITIVGYHDSPSTSDATDGCYFRQVDDVNGGRWQAITRSNSVETGTVTDTGVSPSAATFQRFTIEVNAGGTQVTYYINGTQVAQHSANIPTGASRQATWCAGLRKTLGNTAMSVVIDYANCINELTTAR